MLLDLLVPRWSRVGSETPSHHSCTVHQDRAACRIPGIFENMSFYNAFYISLEHFQGWTDTRKIFERFRYSSNVCGGRT